MMGAGNFPGNFVVFILAGVVHILSEVAKGNHKILENSFAILRCKPYGLGLELNKKANEPICGIYKE